MEIYTTDLVDIAASAGERIAANVACSIEDTQFIIDECCNLQRDIRNILYKRISEQFENLVREELISDIEHSYHAADLRDKLMKIINDL